MKTSTVTMDIFIVDNNFESRSIVCENVAWTLISKNYIFNYRFILQFGVSWTRNYDISNNYSFAKL